MHDRDVILMAVMGVMLVIGLVLVGWFSGTAYEPWESDDAESARGVVLRYLRGVAVALVGGFWAGALVTGPAVRLIMRLLAVTAGAAAQGKLTEAEEVIGKIEFDGTLGLYLFSGILPGLLSGGIYVVVRRWLPSSPRVAGVTFGALHLVLAATRIDPLRPDNKDFDLVGPGWLAVLTFALAAVVHGMAVVAIANRYSRAFPSSRRAILPLVLPTLLLIPGAFLLLPLVVGLAITVLASRSAPVVQAVRGRAALVGGRIAIAVLALVLLPGAVMDLYHVIERDNGVASRS